MNVSDSKPKPSSNKKPTKKIESTKKTIASKDEEFVVTIGSSRITRFERARIIGARSLQLAMGAPPFIKIPVEITNPISIALAEIEANVLPISIRRSLPNNIYQDIPLNYLMDLSGSSVW